MTVESVNVEVVLDPHECWNCHAWYGLDRAAFDRLRVTGDNWFCPYCGKSTVVRTSVKAQLERQLAAARQQEQWANERAERAARRAVSAEMSRRVTKGHLTRVKKRVAAGVCPCCNRTFADLARHMAGKHPEYATEATR